MTPSVYSKYTNTTFLEMKALEMAQIRAEMAVQGMSKASSISLRRDGANSPGGVSSFVPGVRVTSDGVQLQRLRAWEQELEAARAQERAREDIAEGGNVTEELLLSEYPTSFSERWVLQYEDEAPSGSGSSGSISGVSDRSGSAMQGAGGSTSVGSTELSFIQIGEKQGGETRRKNHRHSTHNAFDEDALDPFRILDNAPEPKLSTASGRPAPALWEEKTALADSTADNTTSVDSVGQTFVEAHAGTATAITGKSAAGAAQKAGISTLLATLLNAAASQKTGASAKKISRIAAGAGVTLAAVSSLCCNKVKLSPCSIIDANAP